LYNELTFHIIQPAGCWYHSLQQKNLHTSYEQLRVNT